MDPEHPDEAFIGCGLRGWGLYRTNDGGAHFQSVSFEDRWVWDVIHQPENPDIIWVGTEPPMIYRSAG